MIHPLVPLPINSSSKPIITSFVSSTSIHLSWYTSISALDHAPSKAAAGYSLFFFPAARLLEVLLDAGALAATPLLVGVSTELLVRFGTPKISRGRSFHSEAGARFWKDSVCAPIPGRDSGGPTFLLGGGKDCLLLGKYVVDAGGVGASGKLRYV